MNREQEFDAARERRETGMASALGHAETKAPGWGERAFELLKRYARENPHPFTIEAFRWWAEAGGFEHPPESRAYGPVTQRALREGVIERVGFAAAASSNGSPKSTYSAVGAHQ